jgi:hypothetical protein
VRAVDHDTGLVLGTGLFERGRDGLDVLGGVIGALGTTSENDVDVLVSGGLDDSSKTLLGNTHESMGIGSRLHGVDCNPDTSVRPVLEADGERDTRSELAMELGLGSTSTDSTPRDEISNVLGRDGVEKLGSDGNANVGEIAQKLTGETETLVDLEGTVKVRVVDETLPSNGCAGFLLGG